MAGSLQPETVWTPRGGPAHQEGPGLCSSLFLLVTPNPSRRQVSSSKRIHCLCSELPHLRFLAKGGVGCISIPPSIVLLPNFLAHCPGTLLSPALCCHLLLQTLQKFSESSRWLSRFPQPPA